MKIKQLKQQLPVVQKVYDSIENFERKVDLRHAFKELRELDEWAEEERKKIIQEYANENGEIPPAVQYEVGQKIEKLFDTEVEIEKPLTFKKEEIKKANLKGSELAMIYDDYVNE
ncbi:hypothetical protein KGY79_13520 [Candidatus Bipolaricaulota bacterium]|nr:hypothetical protein [Candidatus Bipolaricaulota bacterium]